VEELSIFVDESGDFGAYEPHSPFYLLTLVFHDQSVDITENINKLNNSLRNAGMPDYTVHTGPLIRREYDHKHLSLFERKQAFNFLYNFVRTTDITYHSIVMEKKHLDKDIGLTLQITKQFSEFFNKHMETLMQYDRIVVYYDYGQRELTHALVTLFTIFSNNVEFRKVSPANYKLFQAADMLCTLELLSLKAERKMLSNSELMFFKSEKELYKSYLKAIQKKRLN